jgi:plastocyanin
MRQHVALVFACVVMAAWSTVACTSQERATAPTPSPTASSSSGAGSANLTIAGNAFESDVVVAPGATVRVHNADTVPHNVVAVDGSFRSPDILPDHQATFIAPALAGRYEFVCTLQPGMRGTLTVTGGPAPGQPTGPDGSTPDAPSGTSGAPGQPAPGQPAPGQPAPGQPAPGQPAPGQPAPGQPAPGQPGQSQPPSAGPSPGGY